MVVAIDGPAGAGKSTLAKALAHELGLPYVNTGLMYRALARLALERGIDPDDGPALAAAARRMTFGLDQEDEPELLIGGEPSSPELSSPEVEAVVSAVARHPEVRNLMRDAQRRLGAAGAVMEGRDIGTVVFPEAAVKIFLSGAPGVRAGRRVRERGGGAEVARAVTDRDSLDSRTNPLVPAPDAHLVDTTALGPEEVLREALRLVRGWGQGGVAGPRG
jgi:cytidylate kinase